MARRVRTVAFWLCLVVSAQVLAESPPPPWEQLNRQQKEVLAPLAQEWNSMDPVKRKKWLGIAKRYPGMTEAEQHRAQLQMRDWYSLTPEQREIVREKYKTIKKLPPDKRQEIKQKWRGYGHHAEDQAGQ
ncbi:MAG TPA: DUF3106 domain-containing protein [Nitrosospira sp.]|nr:DUF3106 domain-containing protein [Nitrosospira sp.]